MDFTDGHLCTVDYSLVDNVRLRTALQYGAKFRTEGNQNDILKSINEGLQGYCEWWVKSHRATENTKAQLYQWRDLIIEKCSRNLVRAGINECADRCTDRQALSKLHDVAVILPVDKTAQNLAICCQRWYAARIRAELLHSSTYEVVSETSETIFARHELFNKDHKFVHANVFPYLYGAWKEHKRSFRWIAGTSMASSEQHPNVPVSVGDILSQPRPHIMHCPTNSITGASKRLSALLGTVITSLQTKSDVEQDRTGYRHCWITRIVDDVATCLRVNVLQFKDRQPRTYDFTTMYTKLPHAQLKHNVMMAVQEAFDYENTLVRGDRTDFDPDVVLKWSFESHQMYWAPRRATIECYDIKDVRSLLDFVVDNVYLQNGTVLRRQVIGIPMGSNCSPELANLYCYVPERAHVQHLQASNAPGLRHRFTFRFIDDILTFDDNLPSATDYGLEFVETTEKDGQVNFLGMKLGWSNGQWRMGIADKQQKLSFPVIRYPSSRSNIPVHQPGGVMIGQLVRYSIFCNYSESFQTAVSSLTQRLFIRGHSPKLLKSNWAKFLAKHWDSQLGHLPSLRRWFARMIKHVEHGNTESIAESAALNLLRNVITDPRPVTTAPISEPNVHATSVTELSSTDDLNETSEVRLRLPSYGEPGGGQKKNECGLLAVNFVMTFWHMPQFTEEQFHGIARQLEQQEASLYDEDHQQFYPRSTKTGDFTIDVILTALQQRGDADYLTADAQLDTLRSLVLNRRKHYVALLRDNRGWYLYDSLQPITPILDIDLYLRPFRDFRTSAILSFVPSIATCHMDIPQPSMVVCPACGAPFPTRRGCSLHRSRFCPVLLMRDEYRAFHA
jgi:hypothetical protein